MMQAKWVFMSNWGWKDFDEAWAKKVEKAFTDGCDRVTCEDAEDAKVTWTLWFTPGVTQFHASSTHTQQRYEEDELSGVVRRRVESDKWCKRLWVPSTTSLKRKRSVMDPAFWEGYYSDEDEVLVQELEKKELEKQELQTEEQKRATAFWEGHHSDQDEALIQELEKKEHEKKELKKEFEMKSLEKKLHEMELVQAAGAQNEDEADDDEKKELEKELVQAAGAQKEDEVGDDEADDE